MTSRSCLAIVLAAGDGTRMRSSRPKVMHEVGGRSMIAHVLETAQSAGCNAVAVVVAPAHDSVKAEIARAAPQAKVFEQRERRGTAHAVLAAREALAQKPDDVLVMFGDTPLVRKDVFEKLRAPLAKGVAVVALGFRPADPSGYGRLVMHGDTLEAIREDKDASAQEREIGLCNAGLMALSGAHALAILSRIGNENAKQEFYLTDAVAIARSMELDTAVVEAQEDDVRGINSKAQLAEAEAALQARLRREAMDNGVTLIAPETVFLAADTKFGADVTVEPNVVFGPGVTVGDGAVIHSFSHIAGAQIGKNVSVGPFARLRPGTKLGDNSRVGNFVEMKETNFGAGAKANHLSYVGDSDVGENANVGAGTITCNYDGEKKSRTVIGKGAFIGSNSALVAPVKVGEGAYVGSGSVITDDVPADALALGRGKQVVKEGWAKTLRDKTPKGK